MGAVASAPTRVRGQGKSRNSAGSDIEQRGQVHAMLLTPDAGTMKTRKPRRVPIHQHVIDQGFLEFVKSRGRGRSFTIRRRQRAI